MASSAVPKIRYYGGQVLDGYESFSSCSPGRQDIYPQISQINADFLFIAITLLDLFDYG
jgi:hypothetical protein